jgi:uncharacterized protein YifE (UPF0438 family)
LRGSREVEAEVEEEAVWNMYTAKQKRRKISTLDADEGGSLGRRRER